MPRSWSASSAPKPGPREPTLSQNQQPRLAPSRDPACYRCLNPQRTPCVVDSKESTWRVGDVVLLQESIHAPVDAVLTEDKPITATRRLSAGTSTIAGTKSGKQRSAIVWRILRQEAATDKSPAVVEGLYVVMASYEGLRTYDTLPDILKLHFALAVSPHCEICAGDGHLHTTPEWQNPHIWLVAYPFASNANVVGRWGWKDASRVHQKDKGFIVEENVRKDLDITFSDRLDGWMTTCLDQKDHWKRCKKEYERFKNATLWTRELEARERAEKPAKMTPPEPNVVQKNQASDSPTTRNNGSTGTSNALPSSETTVAGSSSMASKKDSMDASGPRTVAAPTTDKGATPPADDKQDGFITVESKRSRKLKKKVERQRTMSGLGSMFGGWMGSMKDRKTQSHR